MRSENLHRYSLVTLLCLSKYLTFHVSIINWTNTAFDFDESHLSTDNVGRIQNHPNIFMPAERSQESFRYASSEIRPFLPVVFSLD